MGNAAVSRPLEKDLLRRRESGRSLKDNGHRHSVTLLEETELTSSEPGTRSPIPSSTSRQWAGPLDG